MAKLESPEKLLDYIREWCELASGRRGCLILGPYPYHKFLEGPIIWTWQGYDKEFYCIVVGAHVIELDLKKRLMLEERKLIDIRQQDRVLLGKIVLDTSALISGLALKLIEIGLLNGSEIIVPRTTELELHRICEEGKQLERSRGEKERERGRKLKGKCKKGLDNLNKLKSQRDEGYIQLSLDVHSKEAERSLDYFARLLDKDIRPVVMDEMIRLTAESKGAILLTGDKDLAARAIDHDIEVILLPGDARVEKLKAYHIPIWKLHLLSMLLLLEKNELLVKILDRKGVLKKYKLSMLENKLSIEKLR